MGGIKIFVAKGKRMSKSTTITIVPVLTAVLKTSPMASHSCETRATRLLVSYTPFALCKRFILCHRPVSIYSTIARATQSRSTATLVFS